MIVRCPLIATNLLCMRPMSSFVNQSPVLMLRTRESMQLNILSLRRERKNTKKKKTREKARKNTINSFNIATYFGCVIISGQLMFYANFIWGDDCAENVLRNVCVCWSCGWMNRTLTNGKWFTVARMETTTERVWVWVMPASQRWLVLPQLTALTLLKNDYVTLCMRRFENYLQWKPVWNFFRTLREARAPPWMPTKRSKKDIA